MVLTHFELSNDIMQPQGTLGCQSRVPIVWKSLMQGMCPPATMVAARTYRAVYKKRFAGMRNGFCFCFLETLMKKILFMCLGRKSSESYENDLLSVGFASAIFSRQRSRKSMMSRDRKHFKPFFSFFKSLS